MIGICKRFWLDSIRLYVMYSLIFLCCCLLFACHQSDQTKLEIRWKGNRATALSIPNQLLDAEPADARTQGLSVRLANKETAILGRYQVVDDATLFEPLIPFTRGLTYTVWFKDRPVGTISVPTLATSDKPTLLAVYPTQDSLPDNLLKIYLHFSRPMREGQSQKFVSLIRDKTDTLHNVFLDLQPELWNADRTLLTLWLDPGRIKRDLIPNKRLGAPLHVGNHYRLAVSAGWPDEQGATLAKTTQKLFVTMQRDSLSPRPSHWTIHQPRTDSTQSLELAFGEPLDHSLLAEALHVSTKMGQPIPGKWTIVDEEKGALFKPDQPWKTGQYTVRIDGRLEDLAGNNLNRPFERDMTRKDNLATAYPFVELTFSVR
ncbi:Ig-like domain-containing protein [Spirosoma agri]|uniref:Ig-like domain-containing protein n=2 Tax=Spirosoma agri TaxID=1987381 RepID=A0A6M0IFR7_9BACT|nr:Ig-like domain-containing protein [Spirosoma agri]